LTSGFASSHLEVTSGLSIFASFQHQDGDVLNTRMVISNHKSEFASRGDFKLHQDSYFNIRIFCNIRNWNFIKRLVTSGFHFLAQPTILHKVHQDFGGKFSVRILILINFGAHKKFKQKDYYLNLNWVASKFSEFCS
jgi:hypothetical protein